MSLLMAGPADAQNVDTELAPTSRTVPADCPEGEVTRIFVDNHSVFDPASVPADRRIRWAYRLANRIHVRTRRDFIEDELLLSVGDCYDPVLSRESARILREFRFIASADAFSVPQEDGSRHLLVETRDEWTTKVAGDIRFDGGVEIRGVSVIEENFLGRGISLGAYFREEDERRDVGGVFGIPRIGGGNWDLATAAGRTRVGSTWNQAVIHPFVGEVGTFAFRQRAHAREDLFTWHLPSGLPWTHLVAPLDVGGLEVTAARRFGTTGRFVLVGGGLSREWVRPGIPSEVEGIRAGAFEDREAVPDSISAPILGQLRARDATRVNLLVGVRRVRYQERSGLDALAGVQDVPTGRELLLSFGPSVGGSEGPGDFFLRGNAFGGFATASVVGQLHLSLEGRRERAGMDGAVRDLLGEFHAFLYRKVPTAVPQTLVLRVSGQGGWRTDAPFQLLLGGPDGVRGYPDTAFPGGRRLVVTVEDRFQLPSPLPDLADLGATLFADLGRIHQGDAPWADPSGWRGTVGGGLRIGFPAGSSSVVRIDVAVPLGPGSDGRPRLILQAREWVGIMDDFRNPSMGRARRSGVSSQFTGVNRVPASR
jgi:hypothetical protein